MIIAQLPETIHQIHKFKKSCSVISSMITAEQSFKLFNVLLYEIFRLSKCHDVQQCF